MPCSLYPYELAQCLVHDRHSINEFISGKPEFLQIAYGQEHEIIVLMGYTNERNFTSTKIHTTSKDGNLYLAISVQ